LGNDISRIAYAIHEGLFGHGVPDVYVLLGLAAQKAGHIDQQGSWCVKS
jgi:hypothetical protein